MDAIVIGSSGSLRSRWTERQFSCSGSTVANHPHRLPRAHYIGQRTHFLSACTHLRRELFRNPETCRLVIAQLMRASCKHGFEVIAYILMPDHLHVLVKGLQKDSDFLKWLALFRQLSAYWEKRRSGEVLWQEGYWDYTLRDDSAVGGIASYIVRRLRSMSDG